MLDYRETTTLINIDISSNLTVACEVQLLISGKLSLKEIVMVIGPSGVQFRE